MSPRLGISDRINRNQKIPGHNEKVLNEQYDVAPNL